MQGGGAVSSCGICVSDGRIGAMAASVIVALPSYGPLGAGPSRPLSFPDAGETRPLRGPGRQRLQEA